MTAQAGRPNRQLEVGRRHGVLERAHDLVVRASKVEMERRLGVERELEVFDAKGTWHVTASAVEWVQAPNRSHFFVCCAQRTATARGTVIRHELLGNSSRVSNRTQAPSAVK